MADKKERRRLLMPGRASSASAGEESTAKTPETELDNGSKDIRNKERGEVGDDGQI